MCVLVTTYLPGWLSTPIRDKYGPEEVVVDLLLGATVGDGHFGL